MPKLVDRNMTLETCHAERTILNNNHGEHESWTLELVMSLNKIKQMIQHLNPEM